MSASIRRGRVPFSRAIIRGWLLSLGLLLGAAGFAGCATESTDSDPEDVDLEQVDEAHEEMQAAAPDGLVDEAGSPAFHGSTPLDKLPDIGAAVQSHEAPGADKMSNDPDGGQEPDPHPWRTSTDTDPDNDPHASTANLI